MSDSTITLSGNLATDPEIKPTKNSVLTTFRLAVNDRRKKGDDWVDDPSFFTVVCWRDLATHVAESLCKGNRVIVTGRLKESSWVGQDNVEKKSVEIVADDVAASLKMATIDGIQRMTTSKLERPPQPQYPEGEEPF